MAALDIATLRDIEALSVSPNGEWAAFQLRQAQPNANRYNAEWHIVSTAGGSATQRLADAGPPILGHFQGRVNGAIYPTPPVWSPNSEWIAYLRDHDGVVQIWRSARDGRTEQLTRGDASVRALAYSADGNRLIFETEPSAAHRRAALLEEGLSGLLYDARFFPARSPHPVFPHDVRLGGGAPERSPSQVSAGRIRVYDLVTRRERSATSREADAFMRGQAGARPLNRPTVRGEAATSAGGSLAWTEARDPEQQGFMPPLTLVAQLGGGDVVVCEHAACTGRSLPGLWWRDDRELVFARREGEYYSSTALYSWRPGDRAPRFIMRTDGKLVPSATVEWRCSVADDRLICLFEESDVPRRLVAVDLDTGEIATLFDANPEWREFDLGARPQRIEFTTRAGVGADGYVVYPPESDQDERLPLVVVTYRCEGFLRGGTGDEYPIYALAAQGFAVLCFNAPLGDEERQARQDAQSYVRWARGPGEPEKRWVQECLDAAVDVLAATGRIDPDRVAVTGLSFGAEIVQFALFNMPRLSVAIASGVGYEPTDYYLYGPAARRSFRARGLGAPDATPDRWRALAVTPNADRVTAPLLLHISDHEMVSAVAPVTALEDASRAVEMYVFPNEYHVKWQPRHRLAIYERNIDWLNFWLRDVEDDDPAKTLQYERWRGLRALIRPLSSAEARRHVHQVATDQGHGAR